jgi:hypothetical protein
MPPVAPTDTGAAGRPPYAEAVEARTEITGPKADTQIKLEQRITVSH